ncbi:MAG: DEAD/DEAH box helicase [Planctomycetaceae bacterium]|nr:DEAD/DEAH box helicase [Planctomycetaceae bacterium]
MFDSETDKLIREAPPLKGLDLAKLPQLLTKAFATIVSARIRLRTRAADPADNKLERVLLKLARLASAHEILVALGPDRTNRRSAAFVAATAHQTRGSVQIGAPSSSRITTSSISPEISSALLFLIAEAYPDAAEAARRISIDLDDAGPVERALIEALKTLASGRIADVANAAVPEPASAKPIERAMELLLSRLLKGVRELALQLSDPAYEKSAGLARRMFEDVKTSCIEECLYEPEGSQKTFSVFPGPLHLANLLIAAERDLGEAALALLPAPNGTDPARWSQIIRPIADTRPFLWRNHVDAIDRGYLNRGCSAAISFPTGGGKSTLAELKIATALLHDERVVFLAPTHALVAQTATALQRTFGIAAVSGDVGDEATLAPNIALPRILVTTPERCLMLHSVHSDAFLELGLVVFDECHLLHSRPDDRSRRGLDSMLCLLGLTNTAPGADLLLISAMMKNTEELAGWVRELTGRDCLALNLAWKPTRQVRGCVVYNKSRIKELRDSLAAAKKLKPTQKSVPASLGRTLTARPFGLFSLRQTWSTRDREDYALRALLNDSPALATSADSLWRLTPNGNKVGAAIAAGAVCAGMKTLVFVQSSAICSSCVNEFAKFAAPPKPTLTEEEDRLRARIEEEMGGSKFCYLAVDKDNRVGAGAASHHSLLLPDERELHESLFKRANGIAVLFATSTLAQGMNLPSEVVVICGDSRFDPTANKLQRLEAHELLNAAGRAGRAGDGAHGFVILIPTRVIEFDEVTSEIGNAWFDLQAVFEQSDQCLMIEDPLEAALDSIHQGITATGAGAYLIGRLPFSAATGDPEPSVRLLNRSFAVYTRKRAGDVSWVETRIQSVVDARSSFPREHSAWIRELAAATGLSPKLLAELMTLIDEGSLHGDALHVIVEILNWIEEVPARLFELVRAESLEGLFGTSYRKLPSDDQRAGVALKTIRKILPLWLTGRPLQELESAVLAPNKRLGYCETARHFVLRVVSDLGFVSGLPARLLHARHAALRPEDSFEPSTILATLGGIVREGCDAPESLAVRLELGREASRVGARRLFEQIAPYLVAGTQHEPFSETRLRVRSAMAAAGVRAPNDGAPGFPSDG